MTDCYRPCSGYCVTETQQQSFHALTLSDLGHTQRMVMDCFASSEVLLTREDIAARTNLRLSSVCGRVRELLDAGWLRKRDSRRDTATGHRQELLGLPVAGVREARP